MPNNTKERRGALASLTAILLLLSPLFPDTARSQNGTPFSFMTIGDAGAPGPTLTGCATSMRQAAARMRSEGNPLGMLLFLGDNFYPTGLNRKEEERVELIREVIGPHRELMGTLGRRNVHAVAGNHDYYCYDLAGIPFNTCFTGNEREGKIEEWTYHAGYPSSIRRALAEGSRDSVEFILFDSALPLALGPRVTRQGFDSLSRLLIRSAGAPGVKWRIMAAHHSPFTIGEHGGWRGWSADDKRVVYRGNCIDEGDDPFRYLQEFISHQDNCAPFYREYSDSIFAVIRRSGAKIQAFFAGHDHSLQLMNYPERTCDICPGVFVISGAGSKRERVKSPTPPKEFSSPINNETEKGKSVGGFTICTFREGNLYITYHDATDGRALNMTGNDRGPTTFRITESGALSTEHGR